MQGGWRGREWCRGEGGEGVMERAGRGMERWRGEVVVGGHSSLVGAHCWWVLVVGGWGAIVSVGARCSSIGDRHHPWVGCRLGIIVLMVVVVGFILVVVLVVIVLMVVIVALVVVVAVVVIVVVLVVVVVVLVVVVVVVVLVLMVVVVIVVVVFVLVVVMVVIVVGVVVTGGCHGCAVGRVDCGTRCSAVTWHCHVGVADVSGCGVGREQLLTVVGGC